MASWTQHLRLLWHDAAAAAEDLLRERDRRRRRLPEPFLRGDATTIPSSKVIQARKDVIFALVGYLIIVAKISNTALG